MNSKHPLYTAFKNDVDKLIEQVGPNENLNRLVSSIKYDKSGMYNWLSQRRLVDRIDETLKDNHLWKCIKISYKLRGTKYNV